MLTSVHSIKDYIDTDYTDMRKSINGLSILVADQLELDPLSGHLFAFCNRRRDITKILYWDRNGFCLLSKLSAFRCFLTVLLEVVAGVTAWAEQILRESMAFSYLIY